MDLTEIKFCNKIGYNITNNRQKSDLIEYIYNKYNLNINRSFFKFYSDKYLKNLKNNEYIINLFTQGTEYWLFLTTINNEQYSIFIDKNIQKGHLFPKIIIAPFRFHPNLYNDTLFNGELVRSYNGNWDFLIDDIYIYQGKKILNKRYLDRIKQIYTIFKTQYIYDNILQLCNLKIKKIFTKNELHFIITEFIPKCNYNILGLNFISLDGVYIRFYFQLSNINKLNKIHFLKNTNSLEKIKYKQTELLKDEIIINKKITNYNKNIYSNKLKYFRFLVKHTNLPNIYKLYVNNNNIIKKHSIAKIDTLECADYMRKIFKDKHEYIMECYYYKDFSKWVPIHISKYNEISNSKNINNYISVLLKCKT